MKDFFGKTSTVIAAVAIIVLASGAYLYFASRNTSAYNFASVKKSDITQAVDVNGSVQAAQDIALAFAQAGKISNINVNIGDHVSAGQVLMSLDTAGAAAGIQQARAALGSAQANYQKVVDGATGADIDVAKAAVDSAQVALDNAKASYSTTVAQQQTAVANAYSAMLNSGIAATPNGALASTATVSITGTYAATGQGNYVITIIATDAGYSYQISGMEQGTGIITRGVPLPVGTKGIYITFSSTGTLSPNDSWTISIPNIQASTYLTNYNAYQTALQTQAADLSSAQQTINSDQAALVQAQAALELKQQAARPEDIQAAESAVQGAGAQLALAENAYNNDLITAPFSGTITTMDGKIGEEVGAGQNVATIVSDQQYQMQAYLSDIDFGRVKIGDAANITLDAYGSNVEFPATIASMDQSASIVNGAPAYKTILQFNGNDPRIKSGMTGSARITDATHTGVLIIPQSALITKNGQTSVMVDAGNGKIRSQKVQTGIFGEGNVEITSGLSEGERVVE